MKFRVNWKVEAHEIWTGVVEANSEEEAMQELKEGNYSEEEMVDSDVRSVFDEEVEAIEEESKRPTLEPMGVHYCIQCRQLKDVINVIPIKMKNGRWLACGECIVCNVVTFKSLRENE